MLAYLMRRLAAGVVTILGVLLFLFVLFFLVAKPEDVARKALGERAPQQAVQQWIKNHGYDRPRFWNPEKPSETMLFDHFRRMLTFDFGTSDADDVPISKKRKKLIRSSPLSRTICTKLILSVLKVTR